MIGMLCFRFLDLKIGIIWFLYLEIWILNYIFGLQTPSMNPPQRFLALDVLRGMTVCFMIIVNTPGGPAYAPLNHASWNGFTPTDLVFPTFMFVVGNALSFVMKKLEGLP